MGQSVDSAELQKTRPPSPSFSPAIEGLLVSAITVFLILPCYWQEHIQAGDLSSHLYNAWLAIQIKSSAVQGLSIVPMWNNVLCDWILEILIRLFSVNVAERVVVGAAVLIFFWGGFCLINICTGRRPWLMVPSLLMLSYGLVFRMGFLNFYVSTGICLWAMALLWELGRRRVIAGAILLGLAVVAHPLPVAWAITVLAYIHVGRLVPARYRSLGLLLGFIFLVLAAALLTQLFPTRSIWEHFSGITNIASMIGVEQVWLYGPKYLIVAGGLLLIWAAMFLERVDQGSLLSDPLVQLWILQVAAVVLIPSSIEFPNYGHPLTYITQRMSLFVALLLCMMLGKMSYGRWTTRLSSVVAAIFFIFVYADTEAYNRIEQDLTRLVSTLPPGQRVAAKIDDSSNRIDPLGHILDRACIGHCFSYGNYEPAALAFRVRASEGNRVVASSADVVQEIEDGIHIVTPAEAPLYSICPSTKPNELFQLRLLHAGDKTCSVSVDASPHFW